MKKAICSFIFYRLLGWKAKFDLPAGDKYVMCIAPHTSNWDFFIGKLCSGAQSLKVQFLMKSEWFFGPLKYLFHHIGGIPVERGSHHSLVEQLSRKAKNSKFFHLAVTPEGTRSPNPKWKSGFYYIALMAGIPIVLISLDYKRKCVIADRAIYPSGDIEKDLHDIKCYFSQFKGKHPNNFAI